MGHTGKIEVFKAPHGIGPYGISTTPNGTVYFASLAGGYVSSIDLQTGKATLLQPPTQNEGARRVRPDSYERLWVTEWNVGQLAVYNPVSKGWYSIVKRCAIFIYKDVS